MPGPEDCDDLIVWCDMSHDPAFVQAPRLPLPALYNDTASTVLTQSVKYGKNIFILLHE